MKLLHTADWHLGARSEGIDRWEDQVDRLREVLGYCDDRQVDCLVVAGDVFDEYRGPQLQRLVRDLARLLRPRIEAGMSTVFLAGNHDREFVFPLFQVVQELVAEVRGNKVIFCEKPRVVTMASRDGQEAVDLMMLPYPTPNRYDLAAESYIDAPDRRRKLAEAVRERAREMSAELKKANAGHQVAVVGHFLLRGIKTGSQSYELSETEDITLDSADLPAYSYIALGHIHQAQPVRSPFVRYSGSIERVDFGEEKDQKSVVLIDLGPEGVRGEPEVLPLNATPLVTIPCEADDDFEQLAREHLAEPDRAIVRLRVQMRRDQSFAEIQARAKAVFKRIHKIETHYLDEDEGGAEHEARDIRDVPGTIREYLGSQLADDPDRETLLAMAEELLQEAAV